METLTLAAVSWLGSHGQTSAAPTFHRCMPSATGRGDLRAWHLSLKSLQELLRGLVALH
jgi:hypothetical protein